MKSPFSPSAVPVERPLPEERLFVSERVEAVIREIAGIARPEIAQIFERALPMTLDTAVTR